MHGRQELKLEGPRPPAKIPCNHIPGNDPLLGSGSNVLESDLRARMFSFIRENPGTNMSEVGRALGLAWGSTAWHLRVLEEAALIATRDRGRDKVLLPRGLTQPGMEDLALLRRAPARSVAQLVLQEPEPVNRRDLPDRIARTPRVVSYNLDQLIDHDLITEDADGFLRPTERLERFASILGLPLATDINGAVPTHAAAGHADAERAHVPAV